MKLSYSGGVNHWDMMSKVNGMCYLHALLANFPKASNWSLLKTEYDYMTTQTFGELQQMMFCSFREAESEHSIYLNSFPLIHILYMF